MSKQPTRRIAIAMTAFGIVAPTIVRAQTYPTRPVRVIVPYSAGGGADTVSRILFQKRRNAVRRELRHRKSWRRWWHARGKRCRHG